MTMPIVVQSKDQIFKLIFAKKSSWPRIDLDQKALLIDLVIDDQQR